MIEQTPRVEYWHLWTDAGGVSRQERRALTSFEFKTISEPAAPQWQSRKTSGAMTMLIMVLPVRWIGTWHENPKPQWIVPLSGRWFVESMDGIRVEMGAGEFSFGGDQGSREMNGRHGHLSGTVGDEPAVLMVIQLDAAPLPAISGHQD